MRLEWFNHRRLLESIGNMPSAELKMQYLRERSESAMVALLDTTIAGGVAAVTTSALLLSSAVRAPLPISGGREPPGHLERASTSRVA